MLTLFYRANANAMLALLFSANANATLIPSYQHNFYPFTQSAAFQSYDTRDKQQRFEVTECASL